MKLPAALTPWAKHLQIFPEEISLTLGGYVRKISSFISPLHSSDQAEDGEPNGYDGVARRGIYERLLLSELALADDFSDEFVRRAVMGEHLFLNLARIAPSAKRVSVALFDAGAMQIGTPRIAHLAALIVLARRAEAAGAMFLWGVLQDVQQLVISDDTEASLKILLESRTPQDVTEEDVAAWSEKLADVDKMADVWLVGSENLARFDELKNFSHLYVEESLELEKRELLLKIKSASGAERQTTLELPPPNICTRLLRNPFETIYAPAFKAAKVGGAVTNFFFDVTGSTLFAKLDSNNLLAFKVENRKNAGELYATNYNFANAVKYAAVGRLRKAIALASIVDDQTILLSYRKYGFGLAQGLYRAENAEFSFPADGDGLLQIYNARPTKIAYDEAAILDASGNLFMLTQSSKDRYEPEEPRGAARLAARDVLAVVQTENKLFYVGCEEGSEYHHLVSISDKIERFPLARKNLKQAMFGRSQSANKKVLAFEDENGNWTISEIGGNSRPASQTSENNVQIVSPVSEGGDNSRPLPAPKGEVVGVFQDARFAPAAGVFELMDDRRSLEFCWGYGRRSYNMLKADEEIVKIQVSPRGSMLAYQTVSGELVLFSIRHNRVIGRYSK